MKFGIETTYNFSDNILSFSTLDKLNNSIDLESLSLDDYYVFLKVTFSNSDIKYYTLNNSSDYKDLTYYSLTKNNSNNKIDIAFKKHGDIPYLSINVTKASSLPDDVYDIAIDPSHGGKDKGAKSKDYTESELVLQTALSLKSKLEDIGLKVFISRDGTESSDEDMSTNMYSENGRINLLNRSKAKLMICLHIDNNIYNKKIGGVEVYSPSNCNIEFASLMAKNIVETAGTNYSQFSKYKKQERCICSEFY